MNTYHYGSNVTSNALGVSRAFRAFLNSTAKRGPRPGIETVAHNRYLKAIEVKVGGES